VTVPIGLANSGAQTFTVQNLTARNLRVDTVDIRKGTSPQGQTAKVKDLEAPAIGYQAAPGTTVFVRLNTSVADVNFSLYLSDPKDPTATYRADATLPNTTYLQDKFSSCYASSGSCVLSKDDRFKLAFGDAPGELVLNPTDKNAKEWLNNLQKVADTKPGGLDVKYLKGATITERNDLMSISGVFGNVTNSSGTNGVSYERQLQTAVSTQETKSWEIGKEVSASMLEFLSTTLSVKYNQSYTVGREKLESETVTVTAKPWSFVVFSSSAPVIQIAGDLQFKFAGPNGTGIGPTYIFKDVIFYVPDERANPGKFSGVNVKQEPLGSQGLWLVDQKAPLMKNPVYTAGDRAQLNFYAFTTGPKNGEFGEEAENLTNRTETKFTSSNTAVATVSDTGVLTAVGPGTATVRAQYTWGPIVSNSTPLTFATDEGAVYDAIEVTVVETPPSSS
jgi:hypothetical protein